VARAQQWTVGSTIGVSGPAFIAGVSANGKYFTDQFGRPIPFLGEDVWGVVCNAGQSTSGDIHGDITNYLSTRSAQGYNAAEIAAFSTPALIGFTHTNSQDWDGAWPFTSTNNPSSGLNSTFWAKRDYFITTAQAYGITPVISLTGPMGSGGISTSWTGTQWTDYGTAIGARYASYPNILWITGDDYFGGQDSGYNAMLTAMRAAGDTHLITMQNQQETTSRYTFSSAGRAADPNVFDYNAQYNWVYTYNPSYNGVTVAQQLEPSVNDLHGAIPVLWGDGFYLSSGVGAGQTDVRLERQLIWWALASGAIGFSTGDQAIWTWDSGSAGLMTSKTIYTQVHPAIVSAWTGLPGWQNLISDWGSALVTSGRGTPAADIAVGSAGYIDNTDSYVAASVAADGSLALIYCAQHFSIGINQSLMAAGYSAFWLDPLTGAKTTTTAGASYNSAPMGNNSAGDPDWVLVLKGP
jgi:hypothetical protein